MCVSLRATLTATHIMRVCDVVPVARRRWKLCLVFDGDRHVDCDFLLGGPLLDNFMFDLYRYLDFNGYFGAYGNFILSHHHDFDRHVDCRGDLSLCRVFFFSFDVENVRLVVFFHGRHDVGHVFGDHLRDCLRFFDGMVDHDDLWNFSCDRLEVVLGDLALLSSNDELGLSG